MPKSVHQPTYPNVPLYKGAYGSHHAISKPVNIISPQEISRLEQQRQIYQENIDKYATKLSDILPAHALGQGVNSITDRRIHDSVLDILSPIWNEWNEKFQEYLKTKLYRVNEFIDPIKNIQDISNKTHNYLQAFFDKLPSTFGASAIKQALEHLLAPKPTNTDDQRPDWKKERDHAARIAAGISLCGLSTNPQYIDVIDINEYLLTVSFARPDLSLQRYRVERDWFARLLLMSPSQTRIGTQNIYLKPTSDKQEGQLAW